MNHAAQRRLVGPRYLGQKLLVVRRVGRIDATRRRSGLRRLMWIHQKHVLLPLLQQFRQRFAQAGLIGEYQPAAGIVPLGFDIFLTVAGRGRRLFHWRSQRPTDLVQPVLDRVGGNLLAVLIRQRRQHPGKQFRFLGGELVLRFQPGCQFVGAAVRQKPRNRKGNPFFQRRAGHWAAGCNFRPITLALERIRRQHQLAMRVAPLERLPVDRYAANVELTQAVQQLTPIAAAFTQAGKPGAGIIRQTHPTQRQQRGFRADFQEQVAALFGQRRHAGGKPYRFHHVTAPVVRRSYFVANNFPMKVRDHSHSRD